MSCYAVWSKEPNKQQRVFFYEFTSPEDRNRARDKAVKFAKEMHSGGYPCIVEQFHACDVGVMVFDSEAK